MLEIAQVVAENADDSWSQVDGWGYVFLVVIVIVVVAGFASLFKRK